MQTSAQPTIAVSTPQQTDQSSLQLLGALSLTGLLLVLAIVAQRGYRKLKHKQQIARLERLWLLSINRANS